MNKYKRFSKLPMPEEGEIALSYGVKYLANPEYKPHRHSQERPFLVLDKDKDDNILALKIQERKDKIYKSNYYLNANKYNNEVMTKNSVVETEYVYKLGRGDFIKRGFRISNSDYLRILEKLIFLYVNNMNSVDKKSAKKLHQKLYKGRQAKYGEIIKVPYENCYLYVYDSTHEEYKCIRLYKEKLEDCISYPEKIGDVISYINYMEDDVYIPKKDVIYFVNIRLDKKKTKKIIAKKRVANEVKVENANMLKLKKT